MRRVIKLITITVIIGLIYGCNDVKQSENLIVTSLDYSNYETFGSALAKQVEIGDGAGIDKIFRNSGVVIDESDNTYFAVNGVHPINKGDYTSYYPKSVVKASLKTDEIVQVYQFSKLNSHEIDMEGLCYGPMDGYLFIGDEYNYIYKLNLSTGEIEKEWDLAKVDISTRTDKGVEAITYSSKTEKFYIGIQDTKTVYELELNDDGSIMKTSEFSVPDSPSGLFAHSDGSLYILTFESLYQFNTDGYQTCEIVIPKDLGIVRPDGVYIDSKDEFIYLADSQGPLKDGHSLYKIPWKKPCN